MNDENKPLGQLLYRQSYKDAAHGRLFVPLPQELLEALSEVARSRSMPVGAMAAELIAEALRGQSSNDARPLEG